MERLANFVRSQEAGLRGTRARLKEHSDGKRPGSTRLAPVQSFASPLRHGLPPDWLGISQDDSCLEQSGIYRARVLPPEPINGPLVGTACLEAEGLPLHRQIVDFSRRAQAAGVDRIRLVPLFLLAGVHVMSDIPAEVEQAQQALPGLPLDICPHLGSHPDIGDLLHRRLCATTAETLILLAHGSRRSGSNDSIAKLAQALGGTAAFWTVPPSLESQVIHHMQMGVQRVAVLPYFLFTGSTTDAITRLTEELAERFPQMGFHLLPPLGPSPELARLIVDLALGGGPLKTQPAPAAMPRVAFRHGVRSSSMVS